MKMEKKFLRLKPSCEMFSRFPFFYQGNLEILKSGMETVFQIQWKKRFLKQDDYFSFDYWLRSILSILVLNPFQLLKWKNMSPCHYNQGSNESGLFQKISIQYMSLLSLKNCFHTRFKNFHVTYLHRKKGNLYYYTGAVNIRLWLY